MYILKRTDQGGGYVAPRGSNKSYVKNPREARIFRTINEAEQDRCIGNEVIIPLQPFLDALMS